MQTQTAPAPVAAKPAGIRKLNLGGLATKPASTKTEYPVLTDATGDIALLAGDILRESEEFDALKGSLEAKKGELRRLAADQYFTLMHGRGEIPSSLAAHTADGKEVLVTFQNRYKVLEDEAAAAEILGDKAPRFLRQKLAFKVDADKIPEDKLEAIYQELTGLLQRHGCDAALTATQGIVPTDDFHILRHSQLTPAQNAAFDLACPIVAMVKTKGRGAKK